MTKHIKLVKKNEFLIATIQPKEKIHKIYKVIFTKFDLYINFS